ncbi:MAG: S9 family peptidase [Anaerolineales bacterium]
MTEAQPTVPIEEVARYPRPGLAIPNTFAFSPDGRLVTYLFSAEGDLTQQLYALDGETGEQRSLVSPPEQEGEETLEEQLRRQRLRQLVEGVTRYAWAKEANRLLVPFNDGIYVQDGADAPLRRVVEARGAPLLDPQISPQGTHVAYVWDDELYVVPADGSAEPRQITSGARDTGRSHGLADYIAQEEMHRRHGFWWSPDGERIAFEEADESHIPVYRIVHQGKESVGEGAQEDHRYPFAGEANPRVRLGVVSREGGEPVWMDLGDQEIYLARVGWWPDGGLAVQVENREQTELRLLRFDPETGEGQTLLTERSEYWINLHDMLRPLEDGRFVWASERSGFMHLYLYEGDGTLLRALTQGEWVVDAIEGVAEEQGVLYFTANEAHPTERQLYAVSLTGGEVRRITGEVGTHNVKVDADSGRFVDVHSALHRPPVVTLRSLEDDRVLHTLYAERDPRIDELELEPPEMVSLRSRDGVTLYGLLYRSWGEGPHPTIVSVYGGPHAQRVTNSWMPTVDLRAQHLRGLGFDVFVLDNRGSGRRGLAFESALHRKMGAVEVRDQVDGVRWLVDRGFADPEAVGIYGWSYGGYMAATALARAPEVFKAAVAGAPVTHWDGYDTHYTERYMGKPTDNREGYEESSVLHHVERMEGELLLVHGLIDENVHFRHTARLINALIRSRKPYELLLFPDERHMPRRLADRIYMEERIRDFFIRHLRNEG